MELLQANPSRGELGSVVKDKPAAVIASEIVLFIPSALPVAESIDKPHIIGQASGLTKEWVAVLGAYSLVDLLSMGWSFLWEYVAN